MSAAGETRAECAGGTGGAGAGPVLWASALVLAGMLVMQLGRLGQSAGAPDAAMAAPLVIASAMGAGDVVAQVGEYSLLSFNAGNEDVLIVLDGRNEQLFAYRVRNQREVELLERATLESIFRAAKAVGPGRK